MGMASDVADDIGAETTELAEPVGRSWQSGEGECEQGVGTGEEAAPNQGPSK